jgi:hypothetical protein
MYSCLFGIVSCLGQQKSAPPKPISTQLYNFTPGHEIVRGSKITPNMHVCTHTLMQNILPWHDVRG